jgi:alanine dehydrogenase
MTRPRTIGLPRMMKEPGEKRVFLPEFVQFLARCGLTVHVEEGYGSRSGFTFDAFRQGNAAVRQCSRRQAFEQELVLVLRSPQRAEHEWLRPGACMVSMLHFPTRPQRVERLRALGLNAISLDSIANDVNLRLVENMKAVAWNGLEVAFDLLERDWPGLRLPHGGPTRVLILGTGMVGKHAVDAAAKLGNVERYNAHLAEGGPASLAICVGRGLTRQPARMEALFRETDILVDATQRRDTSLPVVPNAWLGWLPQHAVVIDLAVDPYTLDVTPPVVRGVEGIPQGNLDQYVFHPADPAWSQTVPPSIPSACRRSVVSCYSWPGIHPEACMRHYGQQLEPLMEVLAQKGYAALAPAGGYFERALYRGSLQAFLQAGEYSARPR